MEELTLFRPAMAFAQQIDDFRSEMLAAHSSFDGCSRLEKYDTAQDWLSHLDQFETAATCPPGCVPSSTWLAIRKADGRLVGIIDIRHHIDHPILSVWGGHIGYSVRPGERGKGYAREMLRQVLPRCRALGLDRLLITCGETNPASAHVITANGGILESTVEVDGERIQRYWITL